MAMPERELKALASFLCVSCGKIVCDKESGIPAIHTKEGSKVQGLTTVSKYLAKQAAQNGILGKSKEEEALVNQWLEYRVTQVDRCADKQQLESLLKELNYYLADKVYMVGFHLTLADLLLYYGLHIVFANLTFYEKENYMHVSRWFDQVQHTPGVCQDFKLLHFSKNLLYTGLGISH